MKECELQLMQRLLHILELYPKKLEDMNLSLGPKVSFNLETSPILGNDSDETPPRVPIPNLTVQRTTDIDGKPHVAVLLRLPY